METLGALLPLLLIVAVFWALILRPAQKRQRAQQQLVNAVQPGQRVMTTAGMLGTVVEVTDDQVGIEVAPGVVVRYVKAAVGQILPEENPATDEPADPDEVSQQADRPGAQTGDDTPADRTGA